ncbi:hypothetical protein G4G28_03940 [Massilia sp. Dwa41.01b]|uniref:hypothetical protein n=1 Tax=unclassified Massilia TaxID=2609279 RepID=UPI00160376B7|nr:MULTISPECIES: hypothetical protein [unclassified Massilia]QNA87828.1 hypothetical protein G4G28_03940 [Massilia sp. Dwa41.01b]QNA98730.1 hypothetical protein G4G31_07660 [Massilia sp. Se16.2.3]
MATRISMRHKESGIVKDGFYGFSWTTLFFGFFPALFRGDFITFIGGFVVSLIIAFLTMGVGALFIGLVWAFMYNKYYTRKLMERGYVLAGSDGDNIRAAATLGVAIPAVAPAAAPVTPAVPA